MQLRYLKNAIKITKILLQNALKILQIQQFIVNLHIGVFIGDVHPFIIKLYSSKSPTYFRIVVMKINKL